MSYAHAIAKRLRRQKPAPIAMNDGRPARLRMAQTTIWSLIVAACAAALIAGIYFNVLEVNWHLFWLKEWWDSGMGLSITKSASWTYFRHGYRDQGEPELAFLIVGTLIAKRSTWSRRAPWQYMVLAPFLLVMVSAAGITGGIWVLYFGLPHLLHVAVLNHYLLLTGTVAFGFVLGHLVKPVWAPVGATINGWLIDRSVDKFCIRRQSDPELRQPAWVRHWFLAPLPMRERWVWQMGHNDEITERKKLPAWIRVPKAVLAAVMMVLVAYLVVTGFIAHFWIGSGHSFPFLAP